MKKVKIECHLCQPRYTRTTLKVSHWNKFRIANIYVTFRDHQQKFLNIAKVFKKKYFKCIANAYKIALSAPISDFSLMQRQ